MKEMNFSFYSCILEGRQFPENGSSKAVYQKTGLIMR